jgi:hypothetical protein
LSGEGIVQSVRLIRQNVTSPKIPTWLPVPPTEVFNMNGGVTVNPLEAPFRHAPPSADLARMLPLWWTPHGP